uniref:CBP3 n=1 Tax=Moringa oleifera TaxID=3735 RepID=A0A3G6IGI4_MOROL|nr:CBP3 [Moringa oleifera]
MAKFTLLLAIFALFLILANANVYRTTVELDEEPDDNQQGQQQQQCRQQFLTHQRLRACQRFIRRQTQGGGALEDVEDDVEEIEEVVEPDQARRPAIQRCCQQLRNIQPRRRCPSLRQAVQLAHQQQGQVGPQQVGQMYRLASNIPAICNLRPMSCPFGQQ